MVLVSIAAAAVVALRLSHRAWYRWLGSRWDFSPLRLIVVAVDADNIIEGWIRLLVGEWGRTMTVPWDILVVVPDPEDPARAIVERVVSQLSGVRLAGDVPVPEDECPWAAERLTLVVRIGSDGNEARRHLASLLFLAGHRGGALERERRGSDGVAGRP